MDVEGIAPGVDFREVLQSKLASVDMMLVLIGRGWLELRDAEGLRRLDDAEDFVRAEIRTAVERKIPVTPVLLQGTVMPRERDLPADIRSLAFRNGFEIRHTRWVSDVRDLIQGLGLTPRSPPAAAPTDPQLAVAKSVAPPDQDSRSRRFWVIGAGTAAVGALAVGAMKFRSSPSPTQQPPARLSPLADPSGPPLVRDRKATWTLVITAADPQSLQFRTWSASGEQQWILPIHAEQVEKIVSEGWTSASGAQPYGMGRALGTQLLPSALRSQLEQVNDDATLRVAVDASTARLPWEVVIGNASDRVRPLRVARTVVGIELPPSRQQAARRALIIAAPKLKDPVFPNLPAAVAEGKAVRQILADRGFDVRLNSEGSAADILRDFSGADHRVVLISAHGVRDAKLPSGEVATGIVLSDGTYLTANDFDQLRVSPDLVFFNSMHLGELPLAAGAANKLKGFVPARLLAGGVRTVIAPGMLLDDEEAFKFATYLFAALVDGRSTVGDAMYAARLASQKRQPKRDWWGGYHLYGETDYRIGDA